MFKIVQYDKPEIQLDKGCQKKNDTTSIIKISLNFKINFRLPF
jgi:hypothetical protein